MMKEVSQVNIRILKRKGTCMYFAKRMFDIPVIFTTQTREIKL